MGKRIALLALGGLACLPVIASADTPAAAPFTLNSILTQWGFTANGHLETTYTDFFGRPSASAASAHTFDTTSSFQFNQAMLNFGYTPSDGFGVYVNLLVGNDGRVVNGSYGSGGGDFALEQGWIQYAHGPLTVIGGRFNTLAGEEVIDSWGDTQISRSFLFTLLEPLVHTGVRASWKFSDQLTAYAGLNNSAAAGAGVDNNKSKTGELGVSFTPTSTITLNVVDYYGIDSPSGSPKVRNNYFDAVASWQVTPKLLAALNADLAHSLGGSVGTGADTSFTGKGIAGYVTFNLTDKLAIAGRGELLTVRSPATALPGGVVGPGVTLTAGPLAGATTCTAQSRAGQNCTLSEATLTAIYSPFKNIKLSAEFRHDNSNSPAFGATSGTGAKHQDEIEVGAQYAFGY